MRGRKNLPLDLTPVPPGTPLTFDVMAQAYLEDYVLQLAIRRDLLERMPLLPNRLEENPPREGFFDHDEYLKVCAHAPASYQDVLDFAYSSGWRRNEILNLTWTKST
jgi:integrase